MESLRSKGETPHPQNPRVDPGKAKTSLYTAVQEQRALKIEVGKAMADVIVIDHAERRSANE
jgi:uncharacterized protein (TIGR03435 family)